MMIRALANQSKPCEAWAFRGWRLLGCLVPRCAYSGALINSRVNQVSYAACVIYVAHVRQSPTHGASTRLHSKPIGEASTSKSSNTYLDGVSSCTRYSIHTQQCDKCPAFDSAGHEFRRHAGAHVRGTSTRNEPGALTETRGIGPSHGGGDDKLSPLSLASHQDDSTGRNMALQWIMPL